MRASRDFLLTLLQGYAAILFGEGVVPGLLVLAATMLRPGLGLAGLGTAAVGALLARGVKLSFAASPVYVSNCALVGLFVAGIQAPGGPLLLALLLAAALTVVARAALWDLLWRWDHLPVLSLPFVLVTWALMTVLGARQAVQGASLLPELDAHLPAAVVSFFEALGSVICLPLAPAGLLLFIAVFLSSRILALLAVSGYAAGWALASLWTASGFQALAGGNAFNFPLVAMALGGFFLVPSLRSAGAALAGVLLSVLWIAAGSRLSLPVLAMPFVGAVLLILVTLRRRETFAAPHLVLEHPTQPEVSLERARLAHARGVELGSVPLVVPFFGEWQVYQGFDGPFTHQGPWRHALDFYVHDGRTSFRGDGRSLDQYHCFGLPVLSPAYGVVAACQDDLPDVRPGEVDTMHNWGNHVLIRLASGLHVLLAHLKQGSLCVIPGEMVEPGTPLGACGSSGRSPQPHLHLHVQTGEALGSPTHTFHLVGALCRMPGEGRSEFRLHARPGERTGIASAAGEAGLASAFQFPQQRVLVYRVLESRTSSPVLHRLSVELTLEGQFRIQSESGASAAFDRTEAVFAAYDRNRVPDDFLDVWILALGCSPLGGGVQRWNDRPSSRLLPLARWRRLLAEFLGARCLGLRSRYRRTAFQGMYRQTGLHEHPLQPLLPGMVTQAVLSLAHGPLIVKARCGSRFWHAALVAVGTEHQEPNTTAETPAAGPLNGFHSLPPSTESVRP